METKDDEEGLLDIDPAIREIQEKYESEMKEVSSFMGIWGEQETKYSNCVIVRAVDAEAEEKEVHSRACGIGFEMGVLKTALPEVASDRKILPDPYTLQIVTRCVLLAAFPTVLMAIL